PQTIDEMCDRVMALPDRTKFYILAPVVRGKKGTHKKLLSSLAAQGFVRLRVDGEVVEIAENIKLDKNHTHTIEIVIDRLIKKPGIEERLADSLNTCLRQSTGIALIKVLNNTSAYTGAVPTKNKYNLNPEKIATSANSRSGNNSANSSQELEVEMEKFETQIVFSENFACPEHGAVMEELSPRLFSFNSPYGACPTCHGLGSLKQFSPELIVPDPNAPLYSAIAPWSNKENPYYFSLLYSLAEAYDFDIETPWNKLSKKEQKLVLEGSDEPIWIEMKNGEGDYRYYPGVIPTLEKQYKETGSDLMKQKLEQYLINQTCETCQGKRLKPEALSVEIGQYRITDFTEVSIRECLEKINSLQLSDRQAKIAELVLKEIRARLNFLLDVGLDYLTLDRATMTLSGGEAQRIRLATQIGSGLTGVLYVLDEPSIGLHQRDNNRLLQTLSKLRDLKNTLIVVEHDEETIKAADHIIDIGPGAGVHGGRIISQGNFQTLLETEESLTGAYLSGKKNITTPSERRGGNGKSLLLNNCHRNNLK
ncbi:MAG: excinuclease ABC subunit A, partial [Trichodesmium sp. St11_bin5]|nr:excinuclease ABC subunit A [Trichodesmium sp. St11_bin5]